MFKLDNKMHDLDGLRNDGGKIDIACSWYSVSGHGGPTISPKQSMRLANLGIDLWFDVYFFPDDEVANDSSISPEGAA